MMETFGAASQNGERTEHLQKMYDRVSALAKIGVWECDLASGRLDWTDTVYDLFELPRQSNIDREDIVNLYDPVSRDEMDRLRAKAIESGTGFTLDVRIRTALGNDRWIRLTADIEQEAGRSVRIFGTKQDITAERLVQAKLQTLQNELIHASRVTAMGAMGETVAHEVNQPLTAASNYLSTARRLAAKEGASASLSECIKAALSSTLGAGEIIRRVRNMIGKGHAAQAELELEAVVGDAIALAITGFPNVSVTTKLAGSAPVKADRIQIQQVLINLIRNACESADGRACQIEISSAKLEDHLEVCVADTGPGIAPDVLPTIFESFVTTKHDGLGIGLSISRTIIEAHGGRIRASNLPTGGASIGFTLPLWSSKEESWVSGPARSR